MEVAGVVMGISGLKPIFDTAFEVWRAISEAKNFGDDIARSIRKLTIEFQVFHVWWSATEKLGLRSKSTNGPPEYLNTPIAMCLFGLEQNLVVVAAQSILAALEDIQLLLQKSGALPILQSQSQNPPAQIYTSVENGVKEVASEGSRISRHLMLAIPWRKRVKHGAAPWRETDKERLDNRIEEISYWNTKLYNFLPSDLANNIRWQGISGYVLADLEEAAPISQLGKGVISQQAKLCEAHRKLAENDWKDLWTPEVMKQRLVDLDGFDLPVMAEQDAFSFVRRKNSQTDSFLIEWYNLSEAISTTVDLHALARERLAKLSVLLDQANKPSSLCTADSIGCVVTHSLHRFGLMSRIPDDCSTSIPPVSLHSLLHKKPLPVTSSSMPLPTLSQRFKLAATLATSLHTFLLARWHHKMFNSTNIVFMFPSDGSKLPILSRPLVCGFSVSRPSATGEISICETRTSLSENYLHPDLQVAAEMRPKYTSRYDIYSLGLLMAEIGFWQPISKIGNASRMRHNECLPNDMARRVTTKCASDLVCWMGEQYRDITVWCLQVGDPTVSSSVEDLNSFYWNVVWKLVNCAERAKGFDCS